MGLATHKPRRPEDNWAIIYYPPLAEGDDRSRGSRRSDARLVDYGKTGRVRLTTLTKEFFMPRFLERDECEREPPCEQYPWDGVRNVRPFSRFQKVRGRRRVLIRHRAHQASQCRSTGANAASSNSALGTVRIAASRRS